MIKYKLLCKNCDLKFDSWFASSNEYEKLKQKKLLVCHKCNSKKIVKTIMAPGLINAKNIELNGTGNYLHGAYSYIIKPNGARKLIAWINENGFLPADIQIGDKILDIKVIKPTNAFKLEAKLNSGSSICDN